MISCRLLIISRANWLSVTLTNEDVQTASPVWGLDIFTPGGRFNNRPLCLRPPLPRHTTLKYHR